jgi:tRNA-specific 2-thiouridylase
MQNEKLKMKNEEGITENGERKTENKEGKMEDEDVGSKLQDLGFRIQDTRYELLTSRDSVKDQTYFLSRLTQDQLGRAIFPLGSYTKKEVRAMAKKWNLPTQDRPDSQGLCFLGKINYRDFVKHHLGEREGDIVNTDTGEVVARHTGHWFYTIGQRHGLDLSGGPWYVTEKDVEKNIVFISHRLKMTTVERDTFEVSDFRFLSPLLTTHYLLLTVKVRHGAQM